MPLSSLLSTSRKPLTGFPRFLHSFVKGINVITAVAFLLCAYSVYVSPALFRPIGLFGLTYPFLLGGTLLMFVVSLLFAPRTAWILLLAWAIGWSSIRHYIPFHPFADEENSADFKVLTYNTSLLGGTADNHEAMTQYLQAQHADIVCLQELGKGEELREQLANAMSRVGTPHHAAERVGDNSIMILSRKPIVRSQKLTQIEGNGVMAAWIALSPDDSLLVVNCHLRSNLLTPTERKDFRNIITHRPQQQTESTSGLARVIASKISRATCQRALMIDTLTHFLRQHPHIPTLVCGDFNDTPISYAYNEVKRCGLQNAYASAATGIGRTFNRDAIVVRIDHIFASPHFQTRTARIDQSASGSEHFPLIATFSRPR